MPRGLKIAFGLGFIFLITLIAAGLFLHNLVTKSWTVTSGKIIIDGLHKTVEIYRDDYGVPHIMATDDHDLFFAVGYVHAQDRLWQMELIRRVCEGRLSEIIDTSGIEFDLLFRTLDFKTLADSIYAHLNPKSVTILQDYADGVNEFIRTHQGRFPIEFDMINQDPEPWKPEHSLLVVRLLAWELSFSWWTDLAFGRIETTVSQEKFYERLSAIMNVPPGKSAENLSFPSQEPLRYFSEAVKKYRQYFNMNGYSAGSNSWVVGPSKSLKGKPIIANDPHLIVTLPSHWYEVQMSSPGCNIYGVTIPGVPLIAIGHNDSLAWGFTSAMLDDADFYIEKVDSTKPDRYLYNNNSLPMRVRTEVIYVGKSDSVVIDVKKTHHGVIINSVHPVQLHIPDSLQQLPISLRWAGFDVSDEISGFYRMNRATNADQFVEGLKELSVPAQCVTYADMSGNIGWWMAGRVPIRGKQNGLRPLRGWIKDDEWKGYVQFKELPHVFNPEEDFIVSANQEIGKNSFPYYLSSLWELPYRYNRIRTLLSAEKYSVQDFQNIQQDITSEYEKVFVEEILRVFSGIVNERQEVQNALIYLRNWDNRFSSTDIASSILSSFLVHFVKNVFSDELGNELYYDFVYYPITTFRIIEFFLKKGDSVWFDNINTESLETKDDIIKKSFLDALDELRNKFGAEMKTWQWGKLHPVLFMHPFAVKFPLDIIFNVGPLPAGGSGQTINKGAFQFVNPYSVFSAPSMRFIVDFADPDLTWMVNNLGQSGQPLHPHYSDQTSLWLNGIYRKTTMDRDQIRNQGWDLLVLAPE